MTISENVTFLLNIIKEYRYRYICIYTLEYYIVIIRQYLKKDKIVAQISGVT